MEVVASLSQGRTAAAQCGLFTHKSVPVIFEPPCISDSLLVCTLYCLEVNLSKINFNVNFKIVFKTVHLCISW